MQEAKRSLIQLISRTQNLSKQAKPRQIKSFRRCQHTLQRKSFHKTLERTAPLNTVRASFGTSRWNNNIQTSPFEDVKIHDDVTIPHYVMEHWDEYGDSVALIDALTDKKYTFNELSKMVRNTASGLVKIGLKPGDIVTINSPNCLEYPIVYLAIQEIGAIASPVNPLYTADELEHALHHSEARAVVTVAPLANVAKKAVENIKSKHGKIVKGIVLQGDAEGFLPFSQLASDDGTAFPTNVRLLIKDDTAVLPYSSGTTGLPKGVMLTHHSVVANLCQINTEKILYYEKEKDTLLGLMPFFHIYGQVAVMLSGLRRGVRMAVMPKFEPELYMKTLEKYKVTVANIAPPIAVFMSKHPMVNNYNLDNIRLLLCAAAPLGPELSNELQERMNKPDLKIRQAYGLTELSPASHCSPDDHIKFGSIGVAIHNTKFKIVDMETGNILGPNETGELCVTGPQVMKGYLKNPDATADTIKDGWLHTGDIASYDEDGHVWISDRLKELIKVKGLQVAPAELESLLLSHPAIDDAAVIGIPDDRAGEIPRAYVVLKPDAKVSDTEIQEFIKERVAPYKQLTGGVEMRPEIPKAASGKILRRLLKQEHMNKR